MTLDTFFPYQLAATAEAFSRRLVDVYGREYGLSREEWRLLFLLAGAKNLTSLDLAQRTTLDKVQISRAAQKLCEKGLIQRRTDNNDRRLRVYTCTGKGQALFAELFPIVESKAKAILDAMRPADRNKLMDGLAALQSAIARVPHGPD